MLLSMRHTIPPQRAVSRYLTAALLLCALEGGPAAAGTVPSRTGTTTATRTSGRRGLREGEWDDPAVERVGPIASTGTSTIARAEASPELRPAKKARGKPSWWEVLFLIPLLAFPRRQRHR